MIPEDFSRLLARRLASVARVLDGKSKEYAHNNDRLFNFKRAAAMLDTTPPLALVGMWSKHLVSVLDLADGRLPNTQENVDEKIGDAINYLVLLEATLAELRGESK